MTLIFRAEVWSDSLANPVFLLFAQDPAVNLAGPGLATQVFLEEDGASSDAMWGWLDWGFQSVLDPRRDLTLDLPVI